EVLERFDALTEEVGEADLAGIARAVGIPFRIGVAPGDIANPDLVEVHVQPAHRRLDRQMQTVEADVERHLDAAAHRRLHVVEGDLEPSDGGGHAASLRRALAAAQRTVAPMRRRRGGMATSQAGTLPARTEQ